MVLHIRNNFEFTFTQLLLVLKEDYCLRHHSKTGYMTFVPIVISANENATDLIKGLDVPLQISSKKDP